MLIFSSYLLSDTFCRNLSFGFFKMQDDGEFGKLQIDCTGLFHSHPFVVRLDGDAPYFELRICLKFSELDLGFVNFSKFVCFFNW